MTVESCYQILNLNIWISLLTSQYNGEILTVQAVAAQ